MCDVPSSNKRGAAVGPKQKRDLMTIPRVLKGLLGYLGVLYLSHELVDDSTMRPTLYNYSAGKQLIIPGIEQKDKRAETKIC